MNKINISEKLGQISDHWKLFRPVSLLLYFLTTLFSFVAGVLYASKTGVGKGQGLGGVADVFEVGAIFAIVAFVASVFMASYLKREVIVKTNYILVIVVTIAVGIGRFMSLERKEDPVKESPKKTTAPAAALLPKPPSGAENTITRDRKTPMGLGFFKPDFSNNPVLYLYGNPNFEKSVLEHVPTDSIIFKRLERGSFVITYAPPWLLPDHLKLDYGFLYFRILSISGDFVKVIANTHSQRITYVSRVTGDILYWPDFLLGINSVEFVNGREQTIRNKPSHQAGEVNSKFQFMKPLQIKDDWMMVRLVDDKYKTVNIGWIQWKKDGELLITCSLLS